METVTENETPKRKAVNLTISSDVLKEAKALKLNASRAAESGILAEIKKAKEEVWLVENKQAIEAYNKRIEKEGVSIPPGWAEE